MSESYGSFEEKRRHLIADIARQRGELARAYDNLAKPLQYTESGLRGLSFLRQNSWIFVAVPATLKVAVLILGLVRGKIAPVFSKPRPSPSEREREKSRSMLGHLAHWSGHGWRLFKIYRRIRRYLS